jgi:hypothetical protein
VPFALVKALRQLGHDVLAALQVGRANQAIPDADQLAYAMSLRGPKTMNHRDTEAQRKKRRS